MSIEVQHDVIVVGGGPSGMMAAGRAASRGLRVLLLEKNKDLGKKLSITGGGRCNILNAEADTRTLLSHYGSADKFLFSPFSQFGMKEAYNFFEKNGLPLVCEARKRVFPASQKASDVTDFMRKYIISQNVELKRKETVKKLLIEDGRVVGVSTKTGNYYANSVIIATGGMSRPETGSTGDGFDWLREIGHSVNEPSPNIVPLTTLDKWVHNLSGTALSFMKITFGSDRTKQQGKFSKTGKILFTHFGLSGPLILNSAYRVRQLLQGGAVPAVIDMYPDTELNEVRRNVLKVFQNNSNKLLKTVIKQITPHGMSEAFLKLLPDTLAETKLNNITKQEREQIADLLKALPLTIDGTLGMEKAVVSDGGVRLEEVDTSTMASRLIQNLYFTGDVLNINRPSGGFSLQLCWTTGWVAGSHC